MKQRKSDKPRKQDAKGSAAKREAKDLEPKGTKARGVRGGARKGFSDARLKHHVRAL